MTKEFRLTVTIQHWMHNGWLYINRQATDLIKQLGRYPDVTTCDLVDGLASLLLMLRDPIVSRRGIAVESSRTLPDRLAREHYSTGRL